MAKTSMTVRLEQDLIDRLDALAERVRMTRTDLVERSIIAGLKEGESYANKLENPLFRAFIDAAFSLDPSVSTEDKALLREITGNVKSAADKRRV